MTASSPVTMEDLVNGLIITESFGSDCRVALKGEVYKLVIDTDTFNTVSISSDGLTITFSNWSASGDPTFTGFTFNT